MDTGYGRQGDYARHAYMTQGASFFSPALFFSNHTMTLNGGKEERQKEK